MKRTVLSSALLACALMVSAQTDAIKIDLTQRGAFVSPNLYGIFFEEISHAGDGGLYAELVQNRGFEEHVLPSSMTYDNGRAVAVDSPNYEHGNHRHWSVPWNLEQKKMQGWKAEGWQCNFTPCPATAHQQLADGRTGRAHQHRLLGHGAQDGRKVRLAPLCAEH